MRVGAKATVSEGVSEEVRGRGRMTIEKIKEICFEENVSNAVAWNATKKGKRLPIYLLQLITDCLPANEEVKNEAFLVNQKAVGCFD